MDYSNLDKNDYRYDTAHAKVVNYFEEKVPSPYYIQEGAALAPKCYSLKKINGQTQERSEKVTVKGMNKSFLQFEDYTDKINLDNKK